MPASQFNEATAEPNLTPILDLVFQLITFFMLVINFKSAQLDMNLKLPVIGSGSLDGGACIVERRLIHYFLIIHTIWTLRDCWCEWFHERMMNHE